MKMAMSVVSSVPLLLTVMVMSPVASGDSRTDYSCSLAGDYSYSQLNVITPVVSSLRLDVWIGSVNYNTNVVAEGGVPEDITELKNKVLNSIIWVGEDVWAAGPMFSYARIYSAGGAVKTMTSKSDFTVQAGAVYDNNYIVSGVMNVTNNYPWYEVKIKRALSFYYGGGAPLWDSPIKQMPVSISALPRNEYLRGAVTFTIAPASLVMGLSDVTGTNLTTGDKTYPLIPAGAPIKITCVREKTDLVLTPDKSEIDFGRIQPGVMMPVTRDLNWTATGTGQASIWTMTFDTGADKKDGNNILLGTAKVKVLDSAGTQVPLGTPVNISGVTGTYTFELDPTGATPGTPSADVNVTLTAN